MMKKQNTVLALGYFDSVHIGHRAVLKEAVVLAEKLSATVTVVTFRGNLKAALKKGERTFVYSYSERKELLKSAGADEIWFAPVSEKFLSLSKTEFLDLLNEKFSVCGYCCGKDYRFGVNGEGDAEFLKTYAEFKAQKVEILEGVMVGGVKVSTSRVKELLESGDVASANKLLVKPYFRRSVVITGEGVGKTLGYPTANLREEKGRQPIKCGVYFGRAEVDGISYKAVINYGNAPTFDRKNRILEAHLIDFNGNLYGKEITVFFYGYLRDIKKFSDAEELKDMLVSDTEKAKNTVY